MADNDSDNDSDNESDNESENDTDTDRDIDIDIDITHLRAFSFSSKTVCVCAEKQVPEGMYTSVLLKLDNLHK